MKTNEKWLVLGDLPPPTTGASHCTVRVAELLGADAVCGDLSGGHMDMNLGLSPMARLLLRLRCCIQGCWNIASSGNQFQGVYLQGFAGKGLLLQILLVLVCRLKSLRIVFHTNSNVHYRNYHPLTATLFKCAGSRLRLVVQAESMKAAAQSMYRVKDIVVLQNLCFIESKGEVVARSNPHDLLTLGLLSNLTSEKGVLRLAEVAIEFSRRSSLPVKVVTGGEFESVKLKNEFCRTLQLNNILYENHGQIARDRIPHFYANLDVFIMLSSYPVEAEPLVLYEAALAGLPYIASRNGVIEEQTAFIGCGTTVEHDDIHGCVEILLKWANQEFGENNSRDRITSLNSTVIVDSTVTVAELLRKREHLKFNALPSIFA